MSPTFDRLARPYHLLERLAFGRRLDAVRRFGMSGLAAPGRALLIGDGDGRFACALLRQYPGIVVDSLDLSRGMLRTARARIRRELPGAVGRFRAVQADCRQLPLVPAPYDLVVLHFVLDCLSESENQVLLGDVGKWLAPGGKLLYSDFNLPAGPLLWRLAAAVIIRFLYLFFGLVAGVERRRLPCLVWPEQLPLSASSERLEGLVVAQVRVRSPDQPLPCGPAGLPASRPGGHFPAVGPPDPAHGSCGPGN